MSIVCIGKPGMEYDRGDAVYVATEGMEEQLVKRLCFADEIHIWDMSNEFWLGLVYFQAMLDARTRRTCRIRLMFRDTHIACGRIGKLFEELHDRCLTCGGERRVRHWYAQDELRWKDCPECAAKTEKSWPAPIKAEKQAKTGMEYELDSANGKPSCAVQGGAEFVPPCHSGVGPCNECGGRCRCRGRGRMYRRTELIKRAAGPQPWTCVLCDGMGLERDSVEHAADCLLWDSNVLAIQGVTMTTPRVDVCGFDACKMRLSGRCPTDDWRGHTHEDLLVMCRRYMIQDRTRERPLT
jgi:hypothetical protein